MPVPNTSASTIQPFSVTRKTFAVGSRSSTAVHKLDALAHLTLLKTIRVSLGKVSVEGLIVLDTVDAINGRRIILWVPEVLILVDAFDERRQIEIILAEQDANRLDGAHTSLAIVGAAVGNFHNIVIFYCRADLPQALHSENVRC